MLSRDAARQLCALPVKVTGWAGRLLLAFQMRMGAAMLAKPLVVVALPASSLDFGREVMLLPQLFQKLCGHDRQSHL